MNRVDQLCENTPMTLTEAEIGQVFGGKNIGGIDIHSNEQGTGIRSNDNGTGIISG